MNEEQIERFEKVESQLEGLHEEDSERMTDDGGRAQRFY